MVIVVDTREQLPYQFPCPTVRATLPSGDYSLLGLETRIAIERKRPIELFTCFTSERDRFEREFQRLASYERAAIVIEGDIESCATRSNRWSRVHPKVVIKSLISWFVEYNIAPIFAGARDLGEAYTYYTLEKFHRWSLEKESSSSPSREVPA